MGCSVEYISKVCIRGEERNDYIPKPDYPIEEITNFDNLFMVDEKKKIYKKNWLHQNINSERLHQNKLSESTELVKTRAENIFICSKINNDNSNRKFIATNKSENESEIQLNNNEDFIHKQDNISLNENSDDNINQRTNINEKILNDKIIDNINDKELNIDEISFKVNHQNMINNDNNINNIVLKNKKINNTIDNENKNENILLNKNQINKNLGNNNEIKTNKTHKIYKSETINIEEIEKNKKHKISTKSSINLEEENIRKHKINTKSSLNIDEIENNKNYKFNSKSSFNIDETEDIKHKINTKSSINDDLFSDDNKNFINNKIKSISNEDIFSEDNKKIKINKNETIKKDDIFFENNNIITQSNILYNSGVINIDEIISLGINIGALNTVYSIFSKINDKYVSNVLLMNETSRTIPSILCYTKDIRLFGENSKSFLKDNLITSYNNLSRIFGFDYNSKLYEKEYCYAFQLLKDISQYKFFFYVENEIEKKITPNNIIADFIELINEYFFKKEKINYTCTSLSVPDYYSFSQRRNLRLICEALKMKDINIFSESSAITMYYGYTQYKNIFVNEQNIINKNITKNILFIDSGHSKTSFILSHFKYNEFKVKYVFCDPNLGGRNLDYLIGQYCIKKFKEINKINNLKINSKTKYRLIEEVRNAREKLTNLNEVYICIESFFNNIDLNIHFTKDKFENLFDSLPNTIPNFFENFKNNLIQVLNYAKSKFIFIDYVEIGGELMRTPILQKILSNNFLTISKNLIIDESKSVGAALLGNFIKGNFPIKQLKNFFFYNYYPLNYEIKYNDNNIIKGIILPKGTVDYNEKIIIFENKFSLENHPVHFKLFFPDNEQEVNSKNNFYLKYIIDLYQIFETNKNNLKNNILTYRISVNNKLSFSLGHFYINNNIIKNNIEIYSGDIYKIKIKDKDIFKKKVEKYVKYQDKVDLEYHLTQELNIMKKSLRKSYNEDISEVKDMEKLLYEENLNMKSLENIQNMINDMNIKYPKK